ncbi:LOW QUALITY PROTEIN: inositol 1,4,5-trisphosphate receptor-interacting protein-like 1 [Podargus strigoides]
MVGVSWMRPRTHMQQCAEQLIQKMTWLLQKLEQRTQEPSEFAWEALLFAALQQWQFWLIAAVLAQVFRLWWWVRKRSGELEGGDEEESSSSSTELEEEEKEDDNDDANDVGRFLEQHIHWPVQNLVTEHIMATNLISRYNFLFQWLLLNSFFLVLQLAFQVGSAFEGWSPYEEGIIYRVFVPLEPPGGHSFHLEPCAVGEMLARNFGVRVELECACTTEQLENRQCFLHYRQEELRRNRDPSFLGILCTGSYLDAEKTALWFHLLVKAAWKGLPLPSRCRLKMLRSGRSCKFRVTTGSRCITIEMMFGVQQGNSDIFLSNESTEGIFIPSTMWTESCAVAEMKFFRLLASQAPHDSFHLKCLQVYARILVGTGFSTYTLKTVVMHLLTTIPVSDWCRRNFLLRLHDIMRYLHVCLEEKCLDHFFFGNERVPKELILPPTLQTAEPLNPFQLLVQDPAAQAEALREFLELQDRLTRLLILRC